MHYTRDELIAAIRAVGIRAGDVVSLQVSLGRLGMPHGVAANYAALSNFVIDCFLHVVGPDGTLIVPTYTYSIGRGEVFEVETTPSAIGEFPDIFRTRPSAIRSRDPMLSNAGIGPAAREILRDISRSCYGEKSVFHNLRLAGAKICCVGISLYWSTFRHHIEEQAAVPFRFVKTFTGIVRENNSDSEELWSYFAAPRIANCEPYGLPLERKAREARLVKVANVGRGEIMVIDAQAFFEFGCQALATDPWLTAKGPPAPPEIIFRDEPQYWQRSGRAWALRAQ
ncbi:MAG TPA: AAC(3) family N-acetyltransferase [Pseudolabrys sp.]|nr:AAC(3) family N-acetyltransferase [Pseudolabrys sp.]